MNLLDKIDRLEMHFGKREAEVHVFLPEPGRFDRLRKEAASLQDQYHEEGSRPPLFGLLLGVKDIFHVNGFPTRGGSRLPPKVIGGPEAVSVTRLRNAGALIVGKTVTTEFAYFAPGPTRNPRNLAHTPGGSSSGSAAAIAAGLCDLTLGTQTIGSINRPAAFCGVVGFKPTYERVSREGVIPLSPSLDHIGPFADSVAKITAAMAVLAPDWQTSFENHSTPILGIPEGPYLDRVGAEGRTHFRETVEKLKSAGFTVKAVPTMPDFDTIYENHQTILAYEAARVHEDWFKAHGPLYHEKTAVLIKKGLSLPVSAIETALVGRETLRGELQSLMEKYSIDAWIAPAAPGPAPHDLDSTGDPVMNLPWTQAGLPSISLPTGANEDNLPFGLQVIGKWHQDEELLNIAALLEKSV